MLPYKNEIDITIQEKVIILFMKKLLFCLP
jgi:hypothetical protein